MNTLLFVYGTLKRGCGNHRQLTGQAFIGIARTPPGFRLHDMGGYPGLVTAADATEGVTGEVWSVDARGLARLDAFEGVAEGLYRRNPIALLPPFHDQLVEAYWPARAVDHLPVVGANWRE